MTGLIVLGVAVTVALAFGLYRKATDGRARAATARARGVRLDSSRLGHELGSTATLVQFSTTTCAPCRATHRLLSELTAARPDLTHIDVDAGARLDLAAEFDVTRTPTVLLLDHTGHVRHRIVGVPRGPHLFEALQDLADAQAA